MVLFLQEKHKQILRWLSIMPTAFMALFVSDWAVRLFVWVTTLPVRIFVRIVGEGFVGRFMDSISNYIVGIDSITALVVIASSFASGYATVYFPTLISPVDKKKTALTLAAIYLFLIGGNFFMGITKYGSDVEHILANILLVLGVVCASYVIFTQSEVENRKYEELISRKILTIFLTTSLFTAAIMVFNYFLYGV